MSETETDKERMVALFTSLRIPFSTYQGGGVHECVALAHGNGYSGFVCELHFNERGEFTDHGIWEE